MNPLEQILPVTRLDVLVARYCADEATANERAELRALTDGDPALAKYVEAQRAKFTAAFPNYAAGKATTWQRLEEAMRGREPDPVSSLDRVVEMISGAIRQVSGAVHEIVVFCSAPQLALNAGALPASGPSKSETGAIDGITVTIDASPNGLNVGAWSEQRQQPGTVIIVSYEPPAVDPANTNTPQTAWATVIGRAPEVLPIEGRNAETYELCRVELKPARRNPNRFVGSAKVARETHTHLRQGRYLLRKVSA